MSHSQQLDSKKYSSSEADMTLQVNLSENPEWHMHGHQGITLKKHIDLILNPLYNSAFTPGRGTLTRGQDTQVLCFYGDRSLWLWCPHYVAISSDPILKLHKTLIVVQIQVLRIIERQSCYANLGSLWGCLKCFGFLATEVIRAFRIIVYWWIHRSCDICHLMIIEVMNINMKLLIHSQTFGKV